MSTCIDIVRRALRMAAGEAGVPAGQDADDALEALQGLILDLPGLLHNAHWFTTALSAPGYTAREGQRISVTAPGTVVLPTTVNTANLACWPYGVDGWCDGDTRPPMDLARVQIIGDVPNAGLWLYSASKAAWNRCDALTLQSESPFGIEDDAGLAAQLAVVLADEYGGEVSAVTITRNNASKASLRSRFKKSVCCVTRFRDYV